MFFLNLLKTDEDDCTSDNQMRIFADGSIQKLKKEEAEELLQMHPEAGFIVRESQSTPGDFSISVIHLFIIIIMCVSKISFKLVTQHLNCQMRISPEAPNWFSSHRDVEDGDVVSFSTYVFNLVLLKVRKAGCSCVAVFLRHFPTTGNSRLGLFKTNKKITYF